MHGKQNMKQIFSSLFFSFFFIFWYMFFFLSFRFCQYSISSLLILFSSSYASVPEKQAPIVRDFQSIWFFVVEVLQVRIYLLWSWPALIWQNFEFNINFNFNLEDKIVKSWREHLNTKTEFVQVSIFFKDILYISFPEIFPEGSICSSLESTFRKAMSSLCSNRFRQPWRYVYIESLNWRITVYNILSCMYY